MKMIFVGGIGLALFIGVLLISKKNKTAADRVLNIWIFTIAVHLILFYLWITEDIYKYPFLLILGHPLPLLHGVFLYVYVSFVTKQFPKKRNLLFLHFLPAGLMYAYLAAFFTLSADQIIEIYRNRGAGYELFNSIRTYLIIISGILYVSWSVVLLRRHEKNIRDQFSDLEKVNLRWLKILTFGLGGIWFFVIFLRNDIIIYASVVVFVFLIGYFGIRQTDIFTQSPVVYDDREQRKKYSKSGLSDEVSGELHRELKRLMTEDALYKNRDLSINDLASRLGVHPNYLSQTINQLEKKNFYDFVNTYRIEEFKRLIAMQKNQQFKLLSLAYDCGFSSKTSFNRYFKKVTGRTPSQYSTQLTGHHIPLS
jgi:AraC-like DNA-binding protein